jgi:serine/threonine protein kinase
LAGAVEQKTLGRYKVLGELGRGAMGAVYRAIDPLIEREVAIKTLLPNLPEDVMAEVRERFIREARSAGRLNHPNIVTIFDVGEQDGMAYIAMELLQGRSLQEVLRDPQRLPFDQAAELAAQVADALDAAQNFKIVHRDVKPANVMVDANGRAKLTDFGVAYIDSSTMTQTGTALGSPRYMSPEQVLGQPVDGRADIFSLGVMLYEMLARRTPFERPGDTTVFALMNRIAGEPHPTLRSIDPSIPAGFERVIDRALAKKPEERYSRAGEMARDLRSFKDLKPLTSQEYEKTQVVNRAGSPPPRPALDPAAQTQLITDLDDFAKKFEQEEQQRLREEADERFRKEEETRRWLEAEAKKRDAFEQERDARSAGGATSGAATGKRGALDMLKKQAATQPVRESSEAVRARSQQELDSALRAAFKYLAEVVKEMNSVNPTAEKDYEFLYLGRLPTVTLREGFVDTRPLRLPGKDVIDHIHLRYKVKPVKAAQVSLLGADILRAMEYLKSLKVEFKAKAEQRNDFGKVTKAQFNVTGALPCEVMVQGDYQHMGVGIELTNVRRFGRNRCRVTIPEFNDAVDDLARYVLGVDDDFEKLLRR